MWLLGAPMPAVELVDKSSLSIHLLQRDCICGAQGRHACVGAVVPQQGWNQRRAIAGQQGGRRRAAWQSL